MDENGLALNSPLEWIMDNGLHHKRLFEKQYEESWLTLRACRFIWRQKVPIKVRFFGWLLLRRRLMT